MQWVIFYILSEHAKQKVRVCKDVYLSVFCTTMLEFWVMSFEHLQIF